MTYYLLSRTLSNQPPSVCNHAFRALMNLYDAAPHWLMVLISVNLKKQLDDYLATLPAIRIVRLDKQVGVVQARQQAAALASAEVLVFLDSHCECITGNTCWQLLYNAVLNEFITIILVNFWLLWHHRHQQQTVQAAVENLSSFLTLDYHFSGVPLPVIPLLGMQILPNNNNNHYYYHYNNNNNNTKFV